ncbi:MAG: hypothetical protein ACJ71G_06380, partial [Nitrososphaeraceae archaeon]
IFHYIFETTVFIIVFVLDSLCLFAHNNNNVWIICKLIVAMFSLLWKIEMNEMSFKKQLLSLL